MTINLQQLEPGLLIYYSPKELKFEERQWVVDVGSNRVGICQGDGRTIGQKS